MHQFTRPCAGSIAAVVIGGLCVAMLVAVYNNRENAKAIVLSFLEFELMIAAECLLDVWDQVGDILCLLQVLDAKHKDWVKRLLIPYYIFSAVAAVVSLAALLSKLSLLVSKFRRRRLSLVDIGRHRPHSQDLAHMLHGAEKHRVEYAEKFDRFTYASRQVYCYLVVGIFEDAPMTILNLIFLQYSFAECLEDLRQGTSLCTMTAAGTFVFTASLITSAAMCGFKLSQAPQLKILWSQKRELDKEKARLSKHANGGGDERELLEMGGASTSPSATLSHSMGLVGSLASGVPSHGMLGIA
jgi:hypothetical protein